MCIFMAGDIVLITLPPVVGGVLSANRVPYTHAESLNLQGRIIASTHTLCVWVGGCE